MSAYELHVIIQLWQQEKLTVEQAIGQILLQLDATAKRVGTLEREREAERRSSQK